MGYGRRYGREVTEEQFITRLEKQKRRATKLARKRLEKISKTRPATILINV